MATTAATNRPVDASPTEPVAPLKSAARTLAALDALARHPAGATPKAVSADLGIPLSTAYHLLNTLVAAGYAIQDPVGRLFRLGPRIPLLYDALVEALAPAPSLRPFVGMLQQATGETAQLCRWWGDDVVMAACAEGSRPDRFPAVGIGLSCAPHLMAAGKVLLAWAPAERIAAYLARPDLRCHPDLPPPDPDALRHELARVRRLGYALDRGALDPAVSCVAAPVTGRTGEVEAALGVVVSSARLRRDEPAVLGVVVGIAQAASAAALTGDADPAAETEAKLRATARKICPRHAPLRARRPRPASVHPHAPHRRPPHPASPA